MADPKFYLKDKSAEKETPIHLYIRYLGKRLIYSVGQLIHPKFWNESEQKARSVKELPKSKQLNEFLKFCKGTAEAELMKLQKELGRPPHTIELKIRLDSIIKGQNDSHATEGKHFTFIGLFDRFIQESENGLRLTAKGKRFDRRTIQKYNTVRDTLEKFGKRHNLTFDTINKDFYGKFLDFLNREKYKLNTVGKYIQVVKTFMRYASENGYNQNMYFQTKAFKAHQEPGFSIYLTEKEVNELYSLDLTEKPHLERVRDLFIVGCWTGLRFSDFSNIKQENIQSDFLDIKTFKTGEKVIIPIHALVRAIMSKYDGKYPNSLPPAITNQKMNAYLKEIAKLCPVLNVEVETESVKGGLKVTGSKKKWELVTTHTARRSFATNVYKSGFPAISLMKITGHKTEKAFLLYIKVTPEENAERLAAHWGSMSVLKVG